MTQQEMQAALEAIIYAADEPATIDQLSHALSADKVEVRAALDLLVASYSVEGRGIEVRKVAGGWKFYTKPQHHDVVRRFIKSLQPPIRLTMPALETLAVIAYKQPVTVPEINEIRGVNVGGVIKTLLEKRLITTCGRKEVIGRPILYRTSKQFLMRFGLSDLDELPSLKEFEQLAQAALGSDAGIAPTASDEAQPPQDANIPPGVTTSASDSAASNAAAGASAESSVDDSAAASEAQTIPGAGVETPTEPQLTGEPGCATGGSEADAIADASGEQAAEAESAESPAQSAAEAFTDSGSESGVDSNVKGTSA